MVSAEFTGIVKVSPIELFCVSFTVTRMVTGPAWVGVPLNTPAGLSDSHTGRFVADQV